MTRVLLTAFEPYDDWAENASWLVLEQLTRELPAEPTLTTRLYPVDFSQIRDRLAGDLADNYDVALMLGQAPGAAAIALESVGLNVAVDRDADPDAPGSLADDGPVAYRSSLPLATWAAKIRAAGIPVQVSHHAGCYLCNAALYLSHYLIERMSLKTQAAFLHVPLDPRQVLDRRQPLPAAPAVLTATAIRLMLEDIGGASGE